MKKTKMKTLLTCESSSEALSLLYHKMKSERPELSLKYICNKAGIPSTGYFSDVLKGKKRINIKYSDPLLKVFKLATQERRLISLLIQKDNSKSEEAISLYISQIERVRKTLEIKIKKLDSKKCHSQIWFDLCQVYATLGIFSDGADAKQIYTFLNDLTKKKINECLEYLLENSFIMFEKKKYFWTEKQFFLEDDNNTNESHNTYFKKALQKCSWLLARSYNDNDSAVFMSQIISVDYKKYQEALAELKPHLIEAQSQMETGTADNLVYFNVFIATHK